MGFFTKIKSSIEKYEKENKERAIENKRAERQQMQETKVLEGYKRKNELLQAKEENKILAEQQKIFKLKEKNEKIKRSIYGEPQPVNKPKSAFGNFNFNNDSGFLGGNTKIKKNNDFDSTANFLGKKNSTQKYIRGNF